MGWTSAISSALQIVVFLIVLGLAIAVVYMNHHRLLKEHFQDMSGVEHAFNTVLGRVPFNNEADYFGTLAKDGYTTVEFEMLLKKIVTDTKKAYKEVVEREPDKTELNDTVRAFTTFNYVYDDVVRFVELRHGQRRVSTSGTPIIPSIHIGSQVPIEQRVVDVFMLVLNRHPTSEEVGKYIGMINNRIIYPEDIERMLKDTHEYKQMQQQTKDQTHTQSMALIDKLYGSDFVVPDPVKDKEGYILYTRIVKLYDDTLGRKPTDDELTMYYNKKVGMDELKSILEKQNTTSLDLDSYKIYTEIITMYQSVLERNPTNVELDRYFARVENNTLSLQQLRLILEGSDEYRILTKNQNNSVHSEVSRGLTERQIAFMINTEFVKVYNRSPTAGEETFLRDKIVAYSMDNTMLYEYIARLKSMESGSSTNTSFQIMSGPFAKGVDEDSYSYGLTTDTASGSVRATNDDGGMLDAPEYRGPGSQFREKELFKIAEHVSKLMVDPSKPTGYNQYIQQRNVQTRDTLADQYKTGSKQEGDLLLLQREYTGNWTVPETHPPLCTPCGKKCKVNPMTDQTALIGTLLDDARDTQVGSIMPKFVFQNLPS